MSEPKLDKRVIYRALERIEEDFPFDHDVILNAVQIIRCELAKEPAILEGVQAKTIGDAAVRAERNRVLDIIDVICGDPDWIDGERIAAKLRSAI